MAPAVYFPNPLRHTLFTDLWWRSSERACTHSPTSETAHPIILRIVCEFFRRTFVSGLGAVKTPDCAARKTPLLPTKKLMPQDLSYRN